MEAQFPPIHNNLFAHLDEKTRAEISDLATVRTYDRGRWIVQQGEVWPYLFLVTTGKVTAIKESFEGRNLALASILAGEVFWGLALFHEGTPMPAGLMAVEDSQLSLWQRERILPYILNDGKLAWEISRLMIQRVQFASEIIEKLAFQPVAGRLANLLLEQANRAGYERLQRELTLDEMAAQIGSTREVVSRFLHRFSDEGMIQITRTEFQVTDREKLELMAHKVKG